MDFDLRIGEWDDWWEQTFVQNAATAQNPDVADQQHIFSDIPQGQESGQWTSDQDIRSLLIMVCSRLDMVYSRLEKIETAAHETKTLSAKACNGLRELENGVGGAREALESLRKGMSAFSKCLYRLLRGSPADETDKGSAMEFT